MTYYVTSLTMSDPQSTIGYSSNMVNDVSAPSGVSSNDLMMILDSVFLFWAYIHRMTLTSL